MNQYPHYFKPIPAGCTHVDVYRVLQLFEVADPALQHAVKKLLCAGARGAKDQAQDVGEAIATLQRWQQMRAEESTPAEDPERRKAPWPDFAGNPIFEGDWIVHPSGQRARVRFDPKKNDTVNWSEWRCDYEGDDLDVALALQIGDRGRAVVAVELRPEPAVDPERAAYLARWVNAPAEATHLAQEASGACHWFDREPDREGDGEWERWLRNGGQRWGAPANSLGSVRCEPRPRAEGER